MRIARTKTVATLGPTTSSLDWRAMEWIIAGAAILVALFVIVVYNGLVQSRKRVEKPWG